MNYENIYDNIIKYRKENPAKGYTERHHILPRSLGGDDSIENLVSLTAREHFICHCLLAKMYKKNTTKWRKMNHAFLMMKSANVQQQRYFNSRLYEYARVHFSAVMSHSQQGDKNSQYGKMWICNLKTGENKKVSKCDELPDHWIRGRNKINKMCAVCDTAFVDRKSSNTKCCSAECRQKSRSVHRTGKKAKPKGFVLRKDEFMLKA